MLSTQFPQCPESQTVSIACRNISYSINLKPERIKDEKNDITHPVVLSGLDDREFSCKCHVTGITLNYEFCNAVSVSYRQSIRMGDQINADVQKSRMVGIWNYLFFSSQN